MRCENCFCIYWKDDACILDEIWLDCQGTCQLCTFISLDEKLLERARRNILHLYEEDQKDLCM